MWCYRAKIRVNSNFIGRYLAIWPHSGQKYVFRDSERWIFKSLFLLEFSRFLQNSFCSVFSKGLSKTVQSRFWLSGPNFIQNFFKKSKFWNPPKSHFLLFLRPSIIFETWYPKKPSIRLFPSYLWRSCKKNFVKIFKTLGGVGILVSKIYPEIRFGRHRETGFSHRSQKILKLKNSKFIV